MFSALFSVLQLVTQPAPHYGLPWWQSYVYGPLRYLTGLESV